MQKLPLKFFLVLMAMLLCSPHAKADRYAHHFEGKPLRSYSMHALATALILAGGKIIKDEPSSPHILTGGTLIATGALLHALTYANSDYEWSKNSSEKETPVKKEIPLEKETPVKTEKWSWLIFRSSNINS